MRRTVWAMLIGLGAASAFAGQDGTDVFVAPGTAPNQSSQGKTPPPTPSADKKDSATAQDLTFADVVGAWTGTVKEVDQDPYTINLTFSPGGLGEVSYAGYDCGGILGPVTEGAKLVFKETITTRRDICADGTVVITPKGSDLNWTWINEWNEVQATAVLRRSP